MYCQEEVIFFRSVMCRIIISFFLPDKCCCSSSVMTISYISILNLFSKKLFNKFICFRFFNNPEMMSESIFSNKIILGLFLVYNIIYYFVDLFYRTICKKNRFNIGIIYPYMYHPILLLIGACKLMLFNHSLQIVIDRSTSDNSILGTPFHRLGINVEMRDFILKKPSFLLPFFEILN